MDRVWIKGPRITDSTGLLYQGSARLSIFFLSSTGQPRFSNVQGFK